MNRVLFCFALSLVAMMAGCTGALQRGMQGNAYVSTARPAISMQAVNMPLLTGGEGKAKLDGAGMLGGLFLNSWVAVYGKGDPQSPMAIVAMAEVPRGWYWDSDGQRPFSVDRGVEVFNNDGYAACTYIADSKRDAFATLAGLNDEARPMRWLVRNFAARYNFNDTKVVMEYREPLPENLAGQETLTESMTDQLKAFEKRASAAFAVSPLPQSLAGIKPVYAKDVRWQYLDQRFWGTVSKYEVFDAK
ncbi:DUF4851 domain-containing protein [Desulfovibrio desulfuricans]|uniref:DUF4851 domain-containing protein n=1 Tax=Desulfovibrio desulfuricans TaxID=876 RepID=UPI0035B1BD67